jgi:predicted nucleotidyltransferase
VDVASGLTEFDKNVIKRRKRVILGKAEFYICSIEDLIIYKLFAARYQDLADVKELLSIHLGSIDKKYLADRMIEFCELEREDMKENLDKLLK